MAAIRNVDLFEVSKIGRRRKKACNIESLREVGVKPKILTGGCRWRHT